MEEMSNEIYRAEWPYRDTMAFYTPPSLKGGSDSIDLTNVRSRAETPSTLLDQSLDCHDSQLTTTTDMYFDENGSPCYVSV